MKTLLAICLFVTASLVSAGENPAAVVKGKVLEVKDVETYTYLRLKTKDGETWAAVSKAAVKKDTEVTIENAMIMTNFTSKSLNKTFPRIIFGSLAGAPGSAPALAGPTPDSAHPTTAKMPDSRGIRVSKASGANARTVVEIATKADALKDKPVVVRGQIVKFTPEIMGKNWIHLQDGSGSAKDGTNDILVTTTHQAKIGDVVTVKGIVRTNKDFGAGYAYKVLIEEALLQP